VQNLNIEFNDHVVLQKVTIIFDESSITGIIGANGSGKTVLLKSILGLIVPNNGTIKINSEDILKKHLWKHNIGFVIDIDFINNLSAIDNLRLIASAKGVLSDYDLINILKFVELDPCSKNKYKFFSTGMKQKLRIAQSIMEQPNILILDECFNGLDMEFKTKFQKYLVELQKKGVTIIITSHIQEDIDKLCNIVYEIKEQNLVEVIK